MQTDRPINIVFFHSRVAGYLIGFFNALIDANPQVQIKVIHWDHNIELPFNLPQSDKIQFFSRSNFTQEDLHSFLKTNQPDILTISGWMDKGYLSASRNYKKLNRNVKIVCGLDDSWRGNFRQIVGIFVYRALYRSLFEYVWTSGKPQYAYATIWGYPKEKIIQHFASADTKFFSRKASFSKRLVYLGRFSPEKGILNFLSVYDQLSDKVKREWQLVLIGDGPLKNEIQKLKSDFVKILPFMEKDELVNELNKGGVFCLPSFSEQWGVVVHELAILGYPMLLTSICGANTEFLIEGYNGYSFNPSNKGTILRALTRMTSLDNKTLELFSERSNRLGNRINIEIAAFSMLGILEETV